MANISGIDWKAVSEARIIEAGIYGEAAIDSAMRGEVYQSYHRAMKAAHFAFLAVPDLGKE